MSQNCFWFRTCFLAKKQCAQARQKFWIHWGNSAGILGTRFARPAFLLQKNRYLMRGSPMIESVVRPGIRGASDACRTSPTSSTDLPARKLYGYNMKCSFQIRRGSSVVERRTENPCVGSSTLPFGTKKWNTKCRKFDRKFYFIAFSGLARRSVAQAGVV